MSPLNSTSIETVFQKIANVTENTKLYIYKDMCV